MCCFTEHQSVHSLACLPAGRDMAVEPQRQLHPADFRFPAGQAIEQSHSFEC